VSTPAGLPVERTELAWRRTGLAVATASLVGARVLGPVLGAGALVLGVLGLVLGVLLLVAGTRRTRPGARPGGGLLAVVVLASLAVGLAGLVLLVLRR
jgi:hypothetical protein